MTEVPKSWSEEELFSFLASLDGETEQSIYERLKSRGFNFYQSNKEYFSVFCFMLCDSGGALVPAYLAANLYDRTIGWVFSPLSRNVCMTMKPRPNERAMSPAFRQYLDSINLFSDLPVEEKPIERSSGWLRRTLSGILDLFPSKTERDPENPYNP